MRAPVVFANRERANEYNLPDLYSKWQHQHDREKDFTHLSEFLQNLLFDNP